MNSKEQAEELFRITYREWFDIKGPCPDLPTYMANVIPLAELLEVANCANRCDKAETSMEIDFVFEFASLQKALEALRATGKVEL